MTSVAVIGAGPAGLAAACALKRQGTAVTIFDRGRCLLQRRHDVAEDLATGVGGAGLFSDGKFSFFPSGTHIYQLAGRTRFREAYEWCRSLLECSGIGNEPCPLDEELVSNGRIRLVQGLKAYPSHYASLQQRRALIELLETSVQDSLVTEAQVMTLSSTEPRRYTMGVAEGASQARVSDVQSAVILASGRFGGLDLWEGRLSSCIPLQEIRYEFGIRIESPAGLGFLCKVKSPDVKRLWTNQLAGIRTFCTCRNGEIWNIPCGTISALSGRADGPPTEYSNFGLLARFADESREEGRGIWEWLRGHSLRDHTATVEPIKGFLGLAGGPSLSFDNRPWYPASDFKLGSIRRRTGERLYSILSAAVRELLDWSPELEDERTVCLFPAIEGIGRYPEYDPDLKIPNENIWLCGDVAGRFRGLIPSLVSGYYAGLQAAAALREDSDRNQHLATRGPGVLRARVEALNV